MRVYCDKTPVKLLMLPKVSKTGVLKVIVTIWLDIRSCWGVVGGDFGSSWEERAGKNVVAICSIIVECYGGLVLTAT